jgi:putative transposase
MRFVSYQDRKKIATSMRTIYTAPTVEAAELALKDLDAEWGRQYPGVTDVWRRAWNEFIPFLDYPAELRRIVYTTDEIVNPLLGRAGLCTWVPFFLRSPRQPQTSGT